MYKTYYIKHYEDHLLYNNVGRLVLTYNRLEGAKEKGFRISEWCIIDLLNYSYLKTLNILTLIAYREMHYHLIFSILRKIDFQSVCFKLIQNRKI